MYRDLGLLRPTRRAGGTRKPVAADARSTAETRTKAVDELLTTIRAYLRIATDCKDLARASRSEINDTLEASVAFSALLRPLAR